LREYARGRAVGFRLALNLVLLRFRTVCLQTFDPKSF
jgi:hypothetical protein